MCSFPKHWLRRTSKTLMPSEDGKLGFVCLYAWVSVQNYLKTECHESDPCLCVLWTLFTAYLYWIKFLLMELNISFPQWDSQLIFICHCVKCMYCKRAKFPNRQYTTHSSKEHWEMETKLKYLTFEKFKNKKRIFGMYHKVYTRLELSWWLSSWKQAR